MAAAAGSVGVANGDDSLAVLIVVGGIVAYIGIALAAMGTTAIGVRWAFWAEP